MTEFERFREIIQTARVPIPSGLAEMKWVLETPEERGEGETFRVYREAMKKSPVKFLDMLTKLEGDWLAAEKAHAELEAAKVRAATPAAVAQEQIPDEGTARAREIGEQVLRSLGLPEIPDDDGD
jgi:hypothetical protein